MDQILEQHDKIADGIVAIAELVKQMKEENEKCCCSVDEWDGECQCVVEMWKEKYEELLLKCPASIFVADARKRYRDLRTLKP